MKKDTILLKVANAVIIYQALSMIFVFSTGFVTLFIPIEIYVILFLFCFFISSMYIFFVLVINDNLCPNCNEYFFKKKGEFMNIGFSMYTKKCTNCGYKLKKELDFKDDLLEDRDENSQSEK